MRHEYNILNQSVNVSTEYGLPKMQYAQETAYGQESIHCMLLPVPKGRTITKAFYENVVLKQLKVHFKRCHPKTGLKFLCMIMLPPIRHALQPSF